MTLDKLLKVELPIIVEDYGEIKAVHVDLPGFDKINSAQKKLAYYLCQSSLAGRDIVWDQNYRYGLQIRYLLEFIYVRIQKIKSQLIDNPEWKMFEEYLLRLWANNGIHDHYTGQKTVPKFTKEYFKSLLMFSTNALDINYDEKLLNRILFDPDFDKYHRYSGNTSDNDRIAKSAVNLYGDGIRDDEVIRFHSGDPMGGLSSRLVRQNGIIVELPWKIGGLYDKELREVVRWLEMARPYSNDMQLRWLDKLIAFYHTGKPADYYAYMEEWIKDRDSEVGMIQGFVESYDDPLSYRGFFEGIVWIRDKQGTNVINKIITNAQEFENRLPIDNEFKKKDLKGVFMEAVNAIVATGHAGPLTPIGVNLPNLDSLRKDVGSRSIRLTNLINSSQDKRLTSTHRQFYSPKMQEAMDKFKNLSSYMLTDFHECLGHASGQLAKDTDPNALEGWANTIEEARADLIALWFCGDMEMMCGYDKLNLISNDDFPLFVEMMYTKYLTNGLMYQLKKLKLGDNVHEAHMQNRLMNAKWVVEKAKLHNVSVVEILKNDQGSYVQINNVGVVREKIGELLRLIQRIKSTGDINAAKDLVDQYGTMPDQDLHSEVIRRTKDDLSSICMCFPMLTMIDNEVHINQAKSFPNQMITWSQFSIQSSNNVI